MSDSEEMNMNEQNIGAFVAQILPHQVVQQSKLVVEDCAICYTEMTEVELSTDLLYQCTQCEKYLHKECVRLQTTATCALCRAPLVGITVAGYRQSDVQRRQFPGFVNTNDLADAYGVGAVRESNLVYREVGHINFRSLYPHTIVHPRSLFHRRRNAELNIDAIIDNESLPSNPEMVDETEITDGIDNTNANDSGQMNHQWERPSELVIDENGNQHYISPPSTPEYDEENPHGDQWDYEDV